jgi:hypothetical protein
MTRDVDVVVDLRPIDAERLVELFGDEFECDVDRAREFARIAARAAERVAAFRT